ncbi:hypothetical protein C1645_760318 [Glomus cerebriforme]|uniref:SH3 domain-containing protein n=1 Tax=Glomus cerebriforme TaxID=658196 RepID=A0A397T933_9GLOM|nr:hypothetical protein C1645_760318 [Glomus cerebriforme]
MENWENLLWKPIYIAKALIDYDSSHHMDLNFKAGDIIEVLGIENDDWWNGSIECIGKNETTFKFGSFPKIYVEIIQDNVISDSHNLIPSKIKSPIKSSSLNLKSPNLPPSPPSRSLSLPTSTLSSAKRLSNASATYSRQSTIDNYCIINKNENDSFDPISKCTPIVDSVEFNQKQHFDISIYDFSTVDEYALSIPDSKTTRLSQLSTYLTSVWDHPLYKLRAIFIWITEFISFDIEAYLTGRYHPKSSKETLKTRMANNASFVELFNDLCEESGISSWTIKGISKTYNYEVGTPIMGSYQNTHLWNGVYHEGEYLLIDCTCGSGYFQNKKQFIKKFDEFYFLTSPLHLIYFHFPDNSEHQYLSSFINKQEFISLPLIKQSYLKYGFKFLKWVGNEIEINQDILIFELEQNNNLEENIRLCGKLEWKNNKEFEIFAQRMNYFGPNGGRIFKIQSSCPNRGEGKLIMNILSENNENLSIVIILKVKNTGTGSKHVPLVTLYSTPFQFSLIKPINSILGYTKKVNFQIILFYHNNQELSNLPSEFLICNSNFDKQKYFEIIEDNNEQGYIMLGIDVIMNYKGIWYLAFKYNENDTLNFITKYEVK